MAQARVPLNPGIVDEYRALCERMLVAEASDPMDAAEGSAYWVGIDLQNLGSRHLEDGRDDLYLLWAGLTDIWELKLERRAEAETMMRRAAAEFLALPDYGAALDDYLDHWRTVLLR